VIVRASIFRSVLGVVLLATSAAANIRAMTPADRPGTPEYTVERLLAALASGDADAALACFDDAPWLGTEWEEAARANRAQLEGLTPGERPDFVHYPSRRAIGDGVAPDLGGAGIVICEADFAYTDDAGDWGEPLPCVFYVMRLGGVWKVTLWKAKSP
jgi:hypothetical protein